jgi:hypothetical protein
MAFDLKSLRRGRSFDPPRVVIYGEHGIGKSTFAASAPGLVFIPTEDGIANLETTSFPTCASYADVRDAIGALYDEPHEFAAVCLDSLDWLEALIWQHVCREHGKTSIEKFDFGKGYVFAADVFRELLSGFNALRTERGMAVILTAHCQIKRFDDPTAEPYDRYMPKLHKTASALVQEWADVVGFASEKMVVRKEDIGGFQKQARRAISTGERVLHVTRTAAFDAKNRYGLPDTLPLDWASFQTAISNQGT